MLRRFLFLVLYVMLLLPFVEVILHKSDNAFILQRYSQSYFIWVLFYSFFFISWSIVTFLSIFKWEQVKDFFRQITESWKKSFAVLMALPLILIAMIAFVVFVSRNASDSTPHSATVPIALMMIASLITIGYIISFTKINLLPTPVLSASMRIGSSLFIERLESVAQKIRFRQYPSLVASAVITFTTLILFGPTLFQTQNVIGGNDLLGLFYIIEQYTTRVMQAGKLPLWFPYILSGFPLLDHPTTMVFYPLQLILRLLLPINLSINWGIAIHIWISGMGMYALGRTFKFQSWISLICALVFMLNGELLTRILAGHIWLIYALAWLPLAWLLVIKTLNGNLLALVGAGFVIACIILTGHPTFPGYILLFLSFYWLYHVIGIWQKGILNVQSFIIATSRFSGIVLLALGLSAIQLLPSMQFASEASLSQGYDINGADIGAISWQHLPMIFFPDSYPIPDQGIWEQVPYLGLLLPITAFWAFAYKEQRHFATFLGLTALLSFILAFGNELRLFSLLYSAFPPFRLLRVPPRSLLLWIPSVIVLGGVGLQAISTHNIKEVWVIWWKYLVRSAALIILGIVIGYLLSQVVGFKLISVSNTIRLSIIISIFSIAMVSIQTRIGLLLYPQLPVYWRLLGGNLSLIVVGMLIGFLIFPNALPSVTQPIDILIGFSKVVLIVFTLSLLLPIITTQSRLVPIVALLLVFLTLGDLFTFGIKYIPVSNPQSRMNPLEQEALKVIPSSSIGRFMTAENIGHGNDLALFEISNVDGYHSGFLKGYSTFLRGMSTNPPNDTIVLLSNTGFPQVDEDALDFLGVTYVLSQKPIISSGREFVAEVSGKYFIYKNPNALPRAFWVNDVRVITDSAESIRVMLMPDFDFAKTVVLTQSVAVKTVETTPAQIEITHYDPATGGLIIKTKAQQEGLLVLSEPYYSERHAQIDGADTPLLQANVGFMAVVLPSGSHEVKIYYAPESLYKGALVTLGTGLICLMLMGAGFIQNKKTSSKNR